MQPPCKDCPDRCIGCHGKCEKYIEFDAERKKYLAEKFRKNLLQNDSRYYKNVRYSRGGNKRWPE